MNLGGKIVQRQIPLFQGNIHMYQHLADILHHGYDIKQRKKMLWFEKQLVQGGHEIRKMNGFHGFSELMEICFLFFQ